MDEPVRWMAAGAGADDVEQRRCTPELRHREAEPRDHGQQRTTGSEGKEAAARAASWGTSLEKKIGTGLQG